ncbi:MAG TPA: glutaredoxin family protein [Burkholderiales bacterium]|nr:glutaredoxin family protein [Burkholderiales bacterium]
MSQTLTILSREYCHLCHDMIDAVRLIQRATPFELKVIDVDENPELEEKYGELVPVLLAGDREICHYHLDRDALNAYLKSYL